MDLASLDSLYAAAEAKGAPDALPDGKYQVAVHMVDLKETQSTHKPMIAWQLKVLAGPHAGRLLFKNSVISESTLSFVKQDLTTVGWEKPLSALGDPLARNALLDVKLDVTQKSKTAADGKVSTNIYFNKRLDVVAAAAPGVADADKPPF